MRRLIVLVVGVCCAPGCIPPKTYRVTQTGVVPAPRPMPYDGQPLAGAARIEARFAQVATPLEQTGREDAGNLVARTYTGFAWRGGARDTDLGLELDLAWHSGADPVRDGLGPPPDDVAQQMLFALRHSLPLSRTVRVGVGASAGSVQVPIRVGNDGSAAHDDAGVFQLAVVPSWRRDRLTVFAGATVTSEVKVPRTLIFDGGSTDSPSAYASGSAVVFSMGASFATRRGLRLIGQLALPTGSDYARHGLQLDVALAIDFAARRRARPRVTGGPGTATPSIPP